MKSRFGKCVFALLLVAASTAMLTPANGQTQASFQGLGFLPNGESVSQALGMSADGNVVVGSSGLASQTEAFRWTALDGMQGLGDLPDGPDDSQASSASYDGSTIVGTGSGDSHANPKEAFIWDSTNGMIGIGAIPTSRPESYATAVSADGRIVVGRSPHGVMRPNGNNEAFVWNAVNGVQGLGFLTTSDSNSVAEDVSADGLVVVGSSGSAAYPKGEAFIWTAAGGMQGLGVLFPGGATSTAKSISANGNFVVGSSDGHAFLWDAMAGMHDLGIVAGGIFSEAMGVSADGNTVVGRVASKSGDEAFIWDAGNGMRTLSSVLIADYGVPKSMIGGWRINNATAISDDGRVIVGYGLNPNGDIEAWRVELPPENTGPTITCPESTSAECVNGGATMSISAEVFDADGDPLNIEWHITYPDGSSTTVYDAVMFGNPPSSVAIELSAFYFPHGDSTVELCVDDGIAEAECCSPITVRVEDTQAPIVLTLRELIEVGNDPGECFATVDLDSPESPYAPVFAELCDPNVTAINDAPVEFPIGETVVTWTVSDDEQNTLTVTQTIVVSDVEAPTGTAPADVVVGHDLGDCVATSVDLGSPDVTDNCAVTSIINNAPDEFPIGETVVTWFASDAAGNTIELTQRVTVTNADPVADAGPDLVFECNSTGGMELTLDASASSDDDQGDLLTCHWAAVDITFDDPDSVMPTATFPLGSTTVQLTVTDQCGASSTTDLLIIVQDTTSPQIQAALVDQPVLWPPNHKMIPISLDLLVSDNCTAPENLLLFCFVDSDEPDDDTGDGSFTGDVNNEDGFAEPVEVELTFNPVNEHWEGQLQLRAEREGNGDGRKYSIRCMAMDNSNNATYATVCVTVPHHIGKK